MMRVMKDNPKMKKMTNMKELQIYKIQMIMKKIQNHKEVQGEMKLLRISIKKKKKRKKYL